jgi:hypothetical protein
MAEVIRFPVERLELARLRRAWHAELERVAELDWRCEGRRLHQPNRPIVRAYFRALFRADGAFAG